MVRFKTFEVLPLLNRVLYIWIQLTPIDVIDDEKQSSKQRQTNKRTEIHKRQDTRVLTRPLDPKGATL